MKILALIFLFSGLSFPIADLSYQVTLNICTDTSSPLISKTSLQGEDEGTLFSCIAEEGSAMLYGFTIPAQQLQYKPGDKELSVKDAYAILTASNRIAEMRHLEILSISPDDSGFDVKCRYKEQEGLINIAAIQEFKEEVRN